MLAGYENKKYVVDRQSLQNRQTRNG